MGGAVPFACCIDMRKTAPALMSCLCCVPLEVARCTSSGNFSLGLHAHRSELGIHTGLRSARHPCTQLCALLESSGPKNVPAHGENSITLRLTCTCRHTHPCVGHGGT